MATIPLRSYLHEIEGLIESGRVEEAVAHCRHILKTYPKHIATYRLLGKSFLESQRYGDAADVFQRVHSALPDDFVSHVGMSIIREDEGNLDTALWHMERAFESQPYNTVIQDELRRLYGRRDGMEPPKVRLTRGALARMYAKGDLYQQAIGELRSALAEDPQRPDLQALLARTYYLAGQRVAAVETCSALLKKLPYCLDANLILAAILPETERAQDAQVYRQRVLTLDPYFLQAAPRALNADNVPDHVVAVERLDYIPGQITSGQAEAQPAWASSLGVAFKESTEEALPEWLSPGSGSEGEAPAKVEGVEALGGVSPFGEAPAEQADHIPDWMKEAGWSPSTGEALEEAPALEEGGELAEAGITPTEAAPADIPDWLQQMAPPGASSEELPAQPLEGLGQEEALPWLQEAQPGASDTIITWLGGKEEQVTPPQPPVSPSQTPVGAVPAGIPPTGVPLPTEAEPAEEIPAWMREITQAEAATPSTAEALEGEVPDWMRDLGLESKPPAVHPVVETPPVPKVTVPTEATDQAVPAELPDWLKGAMPVQEAPAAPQAEVIPEGNLPGWLTEDIVAPTPATPTAAPAEEYPAWLKEVEAEVPEEAVSSVEVTGVTDWLKAVEAETSKGGVRSEPSTGITDWLKEVEERAEEEQEEASKAADVIALPASMDLSDQQATLAWLEGLAAKQGVPEEQLITKPEERVVVPPPVMEEVPATLEVEAVAEVPVAEIPAVPAVEIPEWLREVEAEVPAEEAPTQISAPLPAVGIPAPAEAEGVPAGVDLSDEQAGLAWLESLAAKQGVPEEELITKPEERLEVPPAWVQETTGMEEVPATLEVEAAAEVPVAEIPAVPAEEIPEWLREVEAEVPAEEAPTQISAPLPAVGIPLPAEAEGVPAGVDLSDEQAALAWLESLAAKQGVPEEELITKPEERVEVPPAWVQEVAAAESEAPITPAVEVVPSDEKPQWLKDAEAEAAAVEEISLPVEAEAAPIAKAVEAVSAAEWIPETELPAWLKEAEALETAQAVPVAAPVVPVEVEVPAMIVEEVPAPVAEIITPPVALDINEASLGELERLSALGFSKAESIIEYRQGHGPFESIEDLKRVPGIGPATLHELEGLVTVSKKKVDISVEEGGDPYLVALNNARRALNQGDTARAAGFYSKCLKKSLFLDEIILDLQDALYRYPVDVSIWKALGDAYVRNNQLQDALDAYTKAEELLR